MPQETDPILEKAYTDAWRKLKDDQIDDNLEDAYTRGINKIRYPLVPPAKDPLYDIKQQEQERYNNLTGGDIINLVDPNDNEAPQKVGNFLGNLVNFLRPDPHETGPVAASRRIAVNILAPSTIDFGLARIAEFEGGIKNIREEGVTTGMLQNNKNALKLFYNGIGDLLIQHNVQQDRTANSILRGLGIISKEEQERRNTLSEDRAKKLRDKTMAEVDNHHVENILKSNAMETLRYYRDVARETEIEKPEEFKDANAIELLSSRYLPYFIQQDLSQAIGSSVGALAVGGVSGLATRGVTKLALNNAAARIPLSWAGKMSNAVGNKIRHPRAKTAFNKFNNLMQVEELQKNLTTGVSRFATLQGMTASEAALEGVDAYDSYMQENLAKTVQELRQQGLSEEEASTQAIVQLDDAASKIASNVFMDNYAMLLLTNTVELGALFGLKGSLIKPSVGRRFTTKLGGVGKKAKRAANIAKRTALSSASEAFEEGYQFGVQAYESSKGLETSDSFVDITVGSLDFLTKALKEKDADAWTSVVLGGFVGGFTTGVGALKGEISYRKNYNKIKNLSSFKTYKDWQSSYTVDENGKLTISDEFLAQNAKNISDKVRSIAIKEYADERGDWKLKNIVDKELISNMVYESLQKGENQKGILNKFTSAFNNRQARIVEVLGDQIEDAEGVSGISDYYNEQGKSITFDDFVTKRKQDIENAVKVKEAVDFISNKNELSTKDQKRLFELTINESTNLEMKRNLETQIQLLEGKDTTADKIVLKQLKQDLEEVQKVDEYYKKEVNDLMEPQRAKREKRKEEIKEDLQAQKEEKNILAQEDPDKFEPTQDTNPTLIGETEQDADIIQEIEQEQEELQTLEEESIIEEDQELLERDANNVNSITELEQLADGRTLEQQNRIKQIAEGRIARQAEESEKLDGEVRTRSFETINQDLANRWAKGRELLASYEKAELRGNIEAVVPAMVSLFSGELDQSLALSQEGVLIEKEDQKKIDALPEYVKEIPDNYSNYVNTNDIRMLTPSGIAYLHEQADLAPVIDNYFNPGGEQFNEPEITQEEIKEENSPLEDERDVSSEKSEKFQKKARGLISSLFEIWPGVGDSIINVEPQGSKEPIPRIENGVNNFYFLKNDTEYENLKKLQTGGKIKPGQTVHFEIDTKTVENQTSPGKDDLLIQAVVYTDENLNIGDKNENSIRVPIGMLKAAKVDQFNERDYAVLDALRRKGWAAYQGRNTEQILDLGITTTITEAKYGLNQKGQNNTATSDLLNSLQEMPHEIAYFFQSSWRIIKKGNAKPSLSQVYWTGDKTGKAQINRYGNKLGYKIDPNKVNIVTKGKPYAKPTIIIEPVPGQVMSFTLFPAFIRESDVIQTRVKDLLGSITPDNVNEVGSKIRDLSSLSIKGVDGNFRSTPIISYDSSRQLYQFILPVSFRVNKEERVNILDRASEMIEPGEEFVERGNAVFVRIKDPSKIYDIASMDQWRINQPDFKSNMAEELSNGLPTMLKEKRLTTDINQAYPVIPTSHVKFDIEGLSNQLGLGQSGQTGQIEKSPNIKEPDKSYSSSVFKNISKSFFDTGDIQQVDGLKEETDFRLTDTLTSMGIEQFSSLPIAEYLDKLLKRIPEGSLSSTIRTYRNKLSRLNVKVTFDPNAGSYFDISTNELNISTSHLANLYIEDALKGRSQTALELIQRATAHEIAHAYTAARIRLYEASKDQDIGRLTTDVTSFTDQEIKVLDEYFELYDKLLKHPKLKGLYALKNRAELIAEAKSNTAVQEKLSQIEVPETSTSFWDLIKRFINQMFNLIRPQTRTALDVLNEIDQFFLDRAEHIGNTQDIKEINDLLEKLNVYRKEIITEVGMKVGREFTDAASISEMNEFYNKFLMNIYLEDQATIVPAVREKGLLGLLESGRDLESIYRDLDDLGREHLKLIEDKLAAEESDLIKEQLTVSRDKVVNAIDKRNESNSFYRERLINDLTLTQNLTIKGKLLRNFKQGVTPQEEDWLEDGNLEGPVENWQQEEFSINPLTKVTARLDQILNNIPVVTTYGPGESDTRKTAEGYKLNNLKVPTYYSKEDLFGKLITTLDEVSNIDQIEPALVEGATIYPWMNEILNAMDRDPDLLRDLWNGVVSWNRIEFRHLEKVNTKEGIVYLDKRSDLNNSFTRMWNKLSNNFYNSVFWRTALNNQVQTDTKKYLFRIFDIIGLDPKNLDIAKYEDSKGTVVFYESGQFMLNTKFNPLTFYPQLNRTMRKYSLQPKETLPRIKKVVGGIQGVTNEKQKRAVLKKMQAFGVLHHYHLLNRGELNAYYSDNTSKEKIRKLENEAINFAISKMEEFSFADGGVTNNLTKGFEEAIGKISESIASEGPNAGHIEDIIDAYEKIGVSIPRDAITAAYTRGTRIRRDKLKGRRVLNMFVNRSSNRELTGMIDELRAGVNIFDNYKGNVQNLTNLLANALPTEHVATFQNIQGNKRYPYSRPNFITNLARTLKNKDSRENFINSRLGFRFHSKAPIYSLLKSPKFNLSFHINEGISSQNRSVTYSSYAETDIYAAQLFSWYNAFKRGGGNYTIPPMSDAPTSYGIQAPTFEVNEVLDKLLNVVGQEYSRIESTEPIQISNYERNKKSFHFFTSLNEYDSNGNTKGPKPEVVNLINLARTNKTQGVSIAGPIKGLKEIIRKELESRFEEYLNKLREVGILDQQGEVISVVPNQDVIDNRMAQEENLENVLRTFFYNQFFYNTQTITLLAGDPAFYKNPQDIVKRFKQAHTPGVFPGEGEDSSLTVNTLVVSDLFESSPKSLQDLAKELTGKSEYSANDITDGGSIVTMDYQRKRSKEYNEWNEDKERVYNKLKNNDPITGSDTDVSFNVNKPHHFSMESLLVNPGTNDAVLVPTQIKNSEYTLTPDLAYRRKDGTYRKPRTNDYNDYVLPTLAKLLHAMEEREIDKIQFGSNYKVGLPTDKVIDLKDVSTTNENIQNNIVELKGSDYKKVQDSNEKFRDSSVLMGTQIRKLITNHLELETQYDIVINNPSSELLRDLKIKSGTISLSGREIISIFNNIISRFVGEDLKKLRSRFEQGFTEDIIRDHANSKNVSPLVLERLSSGFASVSQFLADPTFSQQFESVINSLFKKAIRTKIPGSALVNEPSVGFSKDLKVIHKDGKVQYFEAALPIWKKSIIANFADNNGVVDIEKLSDSAREAIFYRIPTEGKYSMIPIKVKRFTPTSAGPVIFLPSEFTKITDADFDFDKVYGFQKELRVDYNQSQIDKIVTFTLNKISKEFKDIAKQLPSVSSLKSNYQQYLAGELDIEFMDEGDPVRSFIETANSIVGEASIKPVGISEVSASLTARAGRVNLLIDLMNSIMRTESASKDMLEGASIEELKSLRKQVNSILRPESDNTSLKTNMADPSNLNQFTYNNLAGKNFIGVFANTNGFHGLILNSATQLQTRESYNFGSGGPVRELNRRNSVNSKRTIEKNLAMGVNASVDNSHDAILGELGLNRVTIGPATLMLSLGKSWKDTIYFINQPIIRGYVNYASLQSLKGMYSKEIQDSFSDLVGMNEEVRKSSATTEIMESMLGRKFSKMNRQDRYIQLQLLREYFSLDKASREFVGLTQALKPDSGNIGPNLLNVLKFIGQGQSLREGTSSIINSTDLIPAIIPIEQDNGNYRMHLSDINKSVIPTMNAYFEVLVNELNLTGDDFIYTSKFPYDLVHGAIKDSGISNVSEKVYRKLYTEVVNYVLQNHPSMTFPSQEAKRSFLKNFPIKFKNLVSQDPQMAMIDEVVRFEPVQKGKDIQLFKLSMTNLFTLNPEQINQAKRAMNRLQDEVVNDFVRYVVNTQGLKFNARSLSVLIPSWWYSSNDIVNYLRDYDPNQIENAKDSILSNNSKELGGIVPYMNLSDLTDPHVLSIKGVPIQVTVTAKEGNISNIVRINDGNGVRLYKKSLIDNENSDSTTYRLIPDREVEGFIKEYTDDKSVFPELVNNSQGFEDFEVDTAPVGKPNVEQTQSSKETTEINDMISEVRSSLILEGHSKAIESMKNFDQWVGKQIAEGKRFDEIIGKFIDERICGK